MLSPGKYKKEADICYRENWRHQELNTSITDYILDKEC